MMQPRRGKTFWVRRTQVPQLRGARSEIFRSRPSRGQVSPRLVRNDLRQSRTAVKKKRPFAKRVQALTGFEVSRIVDSREDMDAGDTIEAGNTERV